MNSWAVLRNRNFPQRSEVKGAWLKASTYVGIFLVGIWCNFAMYWGNLSVYTSSYLYYRVKNPGDIQTPWPMSFAMIFFNVGLILSKSVHDCIGKRPLCFIGIIILNGSILLNYFTVQHSILALTFTQGIGVGFGCGIIYCVAMITAVEWTDKRVGLASSSVMSFVCLGTVIINQIITLYINPDNLKPDHFNGKVKYFSQKEILDRVPQFFTLFGTLSLAINLFGLIFMRTRRKPIMDDETSKLVETESPFNLNATSLTYHGNGTRATFKKEDCDCEIHVEETNSYVNISKNERQQSVTSISQDRDTSNEKHKNTFDTTVDYTPREMMMSLPFYALAISVMFSDFSCMTLTRYYKTFGLLYISDDHFLTNVGSVFNACIPLFCIFVGYLSDKIQVKTTLIGTSSLIALISAYYYFTAKLSLWLFGVTTVIIVGTTYSNYSLLTVATLKIFGRAHYSTNFGIASLSGIVLILTLPFLINAIITYCGWFYVFLIVGVANAITLILIIVGFPPK